MQQVRRKAVLQGQNVRRHSRNFRLPPHLGARPPLRMWLCSGIRKQHRVCGQGSNASRQGEMGGLTLRPHVYALGWHTAVEWMVAFC